MRQLVKTLLGLALLAIMALLTPGTALATQNYTMAPPAKWNSIKGTVGSEGVWFQETRNGPRHKTDHRNGDVKLRLLDNVDGGLCARLRDVRRNEVFGTTRCWAPGEYGEKRLATGVRPGTVFIVDAKQWKPRHGTNNHWGGSIFY